MAAISRSKPAEEKLEIDREALADEAWAQLEAYRADALQLMRRLGIGASRWEEKGWVWEKPRWADDPDEWPPVAKLLYLYCRLEAVHIRANMIRHFAGRPHYCPQCVERPTNLHMQWDCVEHTDWPAMVRHRAADLFVEARA